MIGLSREGFKVVLLRHPGGFYLAEALEYITAWKQATDSEPVGICYSTPHHRAIALVARLVNELKLDLSNAHLSMTSGSLGIKRLVPTTPSLS